MRASSSRQRQHGFTLTELLVVIGVIALLIGILLPTLGRARESSRKAACMAHLKTLGECNSSFQAVNEHTVHTR